MKNTIIILLLVICFILGVNSTNVSYSYNSLLDEEIDMFEETITDPNNSYNPKHLKPKENIVNKVASKIEDIMNKVSDKVKSITKGF